MTLEISQRRPSSRIKKILPVLFFFAWGTPLVMVSSVRIGVLPHDSNKDLEEALFADGLSTVDDVLEPGVVA